MFSASIEFVNHPAVLLGLVCACGNRLWYPAFELLIGVTKCPMVLSFLIVGIFAFEGSEYKEMVWFFIRRLDGRGKPAASRAQHLASSTKCCYPREMNFQFYFVCPSALWILFLAFCAIFPGNKAWNFLDHFVLSTPSPWEKQIASLVNISILLSCIGL